MAEQKVCRNCGGTEFFHKSVGANGGYGPRLLPLGFFHNAMFRLRVCGQCGLTDWFVSPMDLPAVREKFDSGRSLI
jgi:predicted nucleic-acid-binding Zn-ribbon protein